MLSQQLSASRAQSAQHLRLQSLIKQSLNAAHLRATVGPGAVVDPAVDVDDQIQELFEARRFLRIKARFAAEMTGTNAAAPASTSARELVARACLLCGDPQTAREIWQQISGADESPPAGLGLGMTYLVEQDHSRAIQHFEHAVRQQPSNVETHCALAVCHLELGNAPAAANECDRALDLPEISEGLQQFSERLREFANQYVRDRD
jgi:Flp pilus assembly protein TadD